VLFPQRVIIGVGELAVSNNPNVTLSTYALGSCVGLVAYDPVRRGGGILHIMLPQSALSPEKAGQQPAMFADTGVPALFDSLRGIGAERRRLRLYLAGGACVLSGPDTFKIGERNISATRQMLSVYGCPATDIELGGTINRTLHLEIATGRLTIKRPDRTQEIDLGPLSSSAM
ncbi:chemotaxis protein CheD, partial [Opitutaceae bacterium TAV3]